MPLKFKLDRIISIATLVASLVAIVLVLKKPAPVAPAQAQAQSAARTGQSAPEAQPSSYQFQASQPQTSQEQPAESSAQSKPSNLSSSDISSAVAQSLSGGTSRLSLDSNVGSGEPNIKDQQVTYDGDTVHGKFLTTIAGKDVWVTISGKMGEKDGYATFDPTEFKVGDMNVPVSLVNPALQKKLAEERDRLKVPDSTPH